MRRATFAYRLLAGVLAAGIAGPAFAQACVQPAERSAFEVRALQSQLMVTALTCSRDQDYNAFVTKFRRELGTAYSSIETHFRRTGGGNFARARDGFITQLANDHSQDGLRQGTAFCPNAVALFQVALAQTDLNSLATLASDRNILNPMVTPACPERPAPTRSPARPAANTRAAAQAR
jgi:hypothetical protein